VNSWFCCKCIVFFTTMASEPLKPTYNFPKPPWIGGRWSRREYKGRKNWWDELGFLDELSERNKFKPVRYAIREKDESWYDPKVEDGTSLAGPYGLDSTFYPNYSLKADQPGNLYEFKDKLMKSSAQYKNIIEKYDISPEHPGIEVSPVLSQMNYTPYRSLGVGSVFPSQTFHQYGPRFFDKPMNEGCVEKGLALTKYVAIGTIVRAIASWKSEYSTGPKSFKVTDIARRSVKFFPFPAAMAFGYGVAICTSATIRNRDDVYNMFYAAAFSGVLCATLKSNIQLGVTVALVESFLGYFWHYQRLVKFGLQGPVINQQYSTYWTGPLFYKSTDFGGLPGGPKEA